MRRRDASYRPNPHPNDSQAGGHRPIPVLLALVTLTLTMAAPATFAQGGSPCAPVPEGGLQAFGGRGIASIDAALFADGSGIVVWADSGNELGDDDRQGIVGRRIGVGGGPAGQLFQVNTLTEEDQFEPAVAAAPDGRFVAVWRSDVSPGDDEGSSIRARVFLPNGTAVGPDFRVNSSPFGPQRDPEVAMADDGSFVVVWYDDSDAPGSSQMNGREVRARRFRADGTPEGLDFVANSSTNGTQNEPAVAMAADGRFVVVFASSGSGAAIQARIFGADGAPVGAQYAVNTTTQGTQSRPAVAMDPDGSFLVAWDSTSSPGTDQDGRSIQARGYTRTGAATGPQKQVNQVEKSSQTAVQLAAAGGREFLAVWASRADGDRVQARALTLEADPLGIEFQAGGFVPESTLNPAVAGNGNGRTVVLFERGGEVLGQTYELPCVSSGGFSDCTEDAATLCLTGDRFKVTVVWRSAQGASGSGNAIELTPDTGYFWFLDAANVETVVKVLDACSFNNRFWVFIGGLTDLNVEFLIEDVETSVVRSYVNPLGAAFLTVNDTNAFDTCN